MPDHWTDTTPAHASAAMTRGSPAATAAGLAATLGLAAASWVVAVRQMNGMDMGAATELGSFGFFAALWVSMMAAMMLPGAASAVVRHVHASGRVLAGPLFVGSYLAVWTLVGVAVYVVYRPHGSFAAGVIAIAAGVDEFTPLRHRIDADAAGAGRHERHLDGRGRRRRPRPEVPAREGRYRCPAGGCDRRTRYLDRSRTLGGSRTHATDVRRHPQMTRRREAMTKHRTGTPEEWLAARLELLEAEKELTRRSDDLARQRQELPWVRIDREYVFDTDEGAASLADLLRGRSQLLVYHFMFGPEYTAGCPACSAIADGFNGFAAHLANHDVMLWAVSRARTAT